MGQPRAAVRRRGWPGVLLWALLVVASIFMMVIGLWRSMFFGFIPEPGLVEDARVGSLYLLGGSAASLAAAAWSILRGHPLWVTVSVGAPAFVVGGISLLLPYSLVRHLVALVALPGAFAGVIGGLADRGYRR
ncbi:hypothetical protein R5O87_19155 [Arthrobacter globiformis]|uniref:hypothetical protein n=1 Tax=Arthrobacter globiformis TaxID=1665 RepID=UPI00397B9728